MGALIRWTRVSWSLKTSLSTHLSPLFPTRCVGDIQTLRPNARLKFVGSILKYVKKFGNFVKYWDEY